MPADPSPSSSPRLRWIGSVDGHLELTTGLTPPATLASPDDIRRTLQNPSITDRDTLAALAAFGMFVIARAVPPTSQAAVLIDALRANAPALQSALDAAAVQGAVADMLDLATQHRGVGVRQLHVRLLNEATAMLPR